MGNDQRHYVLDLLRTFPPDVNYMPGKCILRFLEVTVSLVEAYFLFG